MNTKIIQTPQTQTQTNQTFSSSSIVDLIKQKFDNIPIDVVVSNSTVCIKLIQRVDDSTFKRYIDTAKSLGMRFADRMWCAHVETIREKITNVGGKYYRSFYYFRLPYGYDNYEKIKQISCYTVEKWKQENGKLRREEVEICLASCDENGECRVPRGLASVVAKAFGWNLPTFADLKPPDETYFSGLRPYQVEVFKSVAEQLRLSGTAVVQMATGAGKTHLAGHIAKWLNDQGYIVFMIAMQKDLAIQLKEHAMRAGAKNVIAVTTQYLYNRLKNGENSDEDGIDEESKEVLEYADDYSDLDDETLMRLFRQRNTAVIMDEVHHVPARTVRKVMMEAGDGWALRIGLTATPWRNDNRDLEIYAYAGVVVEPKISSSYLIKNGYAVPVEIRVVEAPYCEEVEKCEGERGAAAYMCIRRALTECEARNKFIVELAKRSEKPVLIITPLVKHAEKLFRLAKAAGLKAALVTGIVKAEKRKEIYDALRRGEIEVLVATTLADEGLDLPPLRTLIIALGGKSKTRALQRIGRLVRPYGDKKVAVAYELKEDYPYIADHLEVRLRLYKTEPHWRIVFDSDDE
ncbi:MAG: DEAD/DEAH box helicase [Pyrobaculum sp.]